MDFLGDLKTPKGHFEIDCPLPLQNFFFPIVGSFETLNQLGDCYPNPSSVLSEPVSSGAAFVRSTKAFKKCIK